VGQQIPVYSNDGVTLIGYRDSDTGIVTGLSGKPADSGPSTSLATQIGNSNSYITPVNGTTNGAPPGAVSYQTIPGYPGWSFWIDANGKSLGSTGPQGQFQPPAKVGSATGQLFKNVVGTTINTLGGNVAPGTNGPPGAPGTPESGTTGFSIPTAAKQFVNSIGAGGVADALSGGGGGGSLAPSDATNALQAALANASTIGNNAGNLAANYQPIAAPTIAGPGPISAATAAYGAPVQAGVATASQAQYQAAIHAQQVQAAQIAAIERAQAATVAATKVGPTALSNAAQIATGPEAEMRAHQLALADQYQNYIAGKEPSAAGIMLRQATDRNVANQYGLAAAASGMNTGLAQRTAMINAGEMNGNEAAQQAILRAQEIAQARGALSGIYDSTRGADIGLATNQAGFQQQTALANQSATNTSTLTQAQIDAARAQEQAQLTTGTSQFNAGQNNTRSIDQAQLSQAASLANQQANLSASTTNATLANQVALANAQYGTQASIANAGNVTQANSTSAQLANAISLANANNQTQANLTGAQLNTQVGIANGNNQVSTNALNQKAVNDLYGNQLTASGQQITGASNQADYYAKLAQAQAQKQASLVGAVSAVGAAALA
jgi:hypothetical protein